MGQPHGEGNVRRKSHPIPEGTQIPSRRHGAGPSVHAPTYRPDTTREYDEKTPHAAAPPELPRGCVPNYRPVPLRWPFLCVLVAVLLGLIALIEYACHALPTEYDWQFLPATGSTGATTAAPVTVGKRQGPASSTPGSGSIGTIIVTSTAEAGSGTVTPPPRSTTSIPPRPVFGSAGSFSFNPNAGHGTANLSDLTETPKQTRAQSDHARDGAVTVVGETAAMNSVGGKPMGTLTVDGETVVTHPAVGETVVTLAVDGETVVTHTVDGKAVATQTMDGELIVTRTAAGETVVMQTPKVTALTNAQGVPTATLTSTPPPILTPTLTTLTDAMGNPTATVSTSAPASPVTTILTDADGVPTATVTEYLVITNHSAKSHPTPKGRPAPDGHPAPASRVYYISKGDYFVGYFLPAVICVLLTIPIRMIGLSAKQFQPFHRLTHEHGVSARESLVLQTGGVQGLLTSVRSLLGGQALIFLTTMLELCSMLLVPVAVESVSLELHGSCGRLSFSGCAMTLGVFPVPARIAIGILALMIVILASTLLVLRGWRSGVASNPWSVAGIAMLSTNPEVRALFASLPTGRTGGVSDKQLIDALGDRLFKLGYFFNGRGQLEYGIMVHDEAEPPLPEQSEKPLQGKSDAQTDMHVPPRLQSHADRKQTPHHLPFLMLSYTGRVAFLLLLTGLLVVILYYNNTGGDTPFERFMDMQGFGVRFLFTGVGVVITFFWSSFFANVALLSPYHLLSQSPQPARRSILPSPPTTAFTGIVSAARRRHGFLAAVAATAMLSEFLPILLNNVPFRVTQTWAAHLACTWLAVAVLCVMWLVVLASFLVRWPHLPADPGTVAGAMYYVCDSAMMWRFEGVATMSEPERDWKVRDARLRFEFGDVAGVSGLRRIGIDSVRGGQP